MNQLDDYRFVEGLKNPTVLTHALEKAKRDRCFTFWTAVLFPFITIALLLLWSEFTSSSRAGLDWIILMPSIGFFFASIRLDSRIKIMLAHERWLKTQDPIKVYNLSSGDLEEKAG